MKIYILHEAVSDDDGNLYSDIRGVYHTKAEATKALSDLHTDALQDFTDPDDCYSRGQYYDISEADDIAVRRCANITEKEI